MNERELKRAKVAMKALCDGESVEVLGYSYHFDSEGWVRNTNVVTGHEFRSEVGVNVLMRDLSKIDDETYIRLQAIQERGIK